MTALRIKEREATQDEWNRKARDAVNALLAAQGIGGTTGDRPTRPSGYSSYFDTTLGKPVWPNGSGGWVDASGASV